MDEPKQPEEEAAPRASASRDQLEELVAEALVELEEGGDEALAAFCARHPRSSGSIRRAVDLLRHQGLVDETDERKAMPEQLGPYRLMDALGGGGMGVVYRARDEAIGRDVALKLVRPDQLYFPGSRERFQREVDTIANLRHAGIVPLYSVGEENGLPYYAMELVEGLTLAEVIAALRGRRPHELTGADLLETLAAKGHADESSSGSQLFRGSWEAVCLRIVREIGETLEYAHRRGVIHRDVKPSNVMITPAGRVLLFDFGLSTHRGAPRITRSGSPVGSFAYMAPEMLRGEAREDDGLLDVYSLGVTLFELLTLRLPFEADTEAKLLAAILRGDAPRVDAYHTGASWEVETLFRAATDPDPRRRYAGPGAFARDVTNALNARPMEARRPGPLLRARRWVQRNPLLAAALLAVVVGPSLFAAQEVRNSRVVEAKNDEIGAKNEALQLALEAEAEAHDTAQRNFEAAVRNRERAEANFGRALAAVDRMLTRVGDETLEGIPHLERVRGELLRDALEFYEELLREEDGGTELRLEVARVAERAADVNAQLGNLQEGERILQRAQDLLEPLHAEAPSDETALPLANVYRRRASLARVVGDTDGARRWLTRLDELGRTLSGPAEASSRLLLASELHELATLDTSVGRDLEARAGLEEAAALLEELVGEDPSSSVLRADLAVVYDELASSILAIVRADPVREASDDLAIAMESAQRAVALCQELYDEDPSDPRRRFRLGRTLGNAASTLQQENRAGESLEPASRSFELLEELVRDFPSVPIYRRDLATVCTGLGATLTMGARFDEARRRLRRAVELLEGLEPEGDARLLGTLGAAYYNLAATYRVVGEADRAEGEYWSALERFDATVQLAPTHAMFLNFRQETLNSLTSMLLLDEQRHEEAFELIVRTIEAAPNAKQLLVALGFAETLLVRTDELADLEPDERTERIERAAYAAGDLASRAIQHGVVSENAVRRDQLDRLWAEPAFVDAIGFER